MLALWWGFVTAIRHVRAEKLKKSKLIGSTIMPCFFCPIKKFRVWPIESWIKVIGLSYHVSRELRDGLHYTKDGYLELGGEFAHHICMISGFMIGAIVEILVYHGVPFPKKVTYMMNGMAFLIQLIIMTGHQNEGLEFVVHKIWTILIFLTLLSGLCEFYNPNYIWSIYCRIGFFLTQGSWLMQAAYVLYGHSKNPHFIWVDDHKTHVWLNVNAMMHMQIAICTLMTQYVVVYYAINFLDRFYSRYELDVETDSKTLRIVRCDNKENNNSNDANYKEYSVLLNSDDNEYD